MYTIIGLGNPGAEYETTRHNVGWIVLREIVARHTLPSFTKSSPFSGLLSEGMLHNTEVGILFPTTFMNNSGTATAKYVKEKGSLDTLIVVHDDIDIAFGEVKISYDRGSGGHNGIKSIIDALGSPKFVRIRVGIAPRGFFGNIKRPAGEKLSQYVLGNFKTGELKSIETISEKVDTAISRIVEKGVAIAMQEVNSKE